MGTSSQIIVGLVKAFAEIVFKVTLLAIEYNATVKVKVLLEDEDHLDIRLFETYPLMGCYFLMCADLSTIMPIDCFGMPGWMDAIERMKRTGYDDIRESAEAFIKKSPWQIAGMPKTPAEAQISMRKIVGEALFLGGVIVEGVEGKEIGASDG